MGNADKLGAKICLVTGATSGIGQATALGLARMGATVEIVARDARKGEVVVNEIKSQSGNTAVDLLVADLSSQAAIHQLVEEFKARHPRLHVLINNAGGTFSKRSLTEDGLEYTFAFNHLAYFLLANLLLDVLKASDPARIVNVTSRLPAGATINLEDLQGERHYSGFRAYSQSKLCNMLFTYELARRITGTGVTVNCVHPGVVRTNFGKGTTPLPLQIMSQLGRPFMARPEKAAERLLYLASSPEVEGVSGKYFANKQELKSPKQTYDQAVAQRLWQISTELTKLNA